MELERNGSLFLLKVNKIKGLTWNHIKLSFNFKGISKIIFWNYKIEKETKVTQKFYFLQPNREWGRPAPWPTLVWSGSNKEVSKYIFIQADLGYFVFAIIK